MEQQTKTIYYFNDNRLENGIKKFEVVQEYYLIEEITKNKEIKYLNSNYNIDRDEYYCDENWLDKIDVKWENLGIMIHNTRLFGKVYLSYDYDKLINFYKEIANEKVIEYKFKSQQISKLLKQMGDRQLEEMSDVNG